MHSRNSPALVHLCTRLAHGSSTGMGPPLASQSQRLLFPIGNTLTTSPFGQIGSAHRKPKRTSNGRAPVGMLCAHSWRMAHTLTIWKVKETHSHVQHMDPITIASLPLRINTIPPTSSA